MEDPLYTYNIPLVDTHAHICDASFDTDREEVLLRAEQAGISTIIAVGEDLKDAKKNLDLAKKLPLIKPAAGLYPTLLDRDAAEEMICFIRTNRQQLIAVGEVGLDFWKVKEKEDREQQRQIFSSFIELAIELDLPLNVHSRSAGRHAVEMLILKGARRVQMHAFDGKFTYARPAAEAGYFFSVPPSITRSRQKQKLVKHLPLNCLLAETDSPVLGSDPEKRNEPARLVTVIRAIAGIKGLSEKTVAHTVSENTQKLYRL